MTEQQPPVTPDNPVDSGQGTPPTPTEQQAAQTQQEVQIQTPLTPAEHRTYAQALYQQPAFVVDSVFASGKLDPNGTYTQGEVQQAIDQMMMEPDKTFQPEEAPQ